MNKDFWMVAILSPSAEIREGFGAYICKVKDGVLTGLIDKQDAGGVVIRDIAGQKHAVKQADIESLEASPVSLMPEGLLGGLSDADLKDFSAFLRRALHQTKSSRTLPLSHYISWSELLRRTFEIDTICPRCKSPLRLIALIKTDDTIKKILSAMGLPTEAPKPYPARPPPSESGGEGGDWLN